MATLHAPQYSEFCKLKCNILYYIEARLVKTKFEHQPNRLENMKILYCIDYLPLERCNVRTLVILCWID